MPTRGQQLEAVRKLVRESVATVDAIAPDAIRSILPVLRQVRDELRSDLQDWLATAPDGAERFTAYQRTQALRSIEGAIDHVRELQPAMARALARGRHDTGPLAIGNLDTEIQRLSAIFGGGMPHVPAIDTAAIIAKGDRLLWKRHERSAQRYAGQVGEDIKQLFSVGVAKGETIEQLVNRLRRVGNPTARRGPIDPGVASAEIADGLFKRHRWWGERLVRTEVMTAYNVQHDAAIEYANDHRPEGEDEFLRRWDSSADFRTCVLCADLDGKVTTIDGAFPGGIVNPPRHPCCRCVVLAWLRRWGDMKGETQARGPLPPQREVKEPDTKPSEDEAAAPVVWEHKNNPRRVEAAKKAAEASAERRREIHSAVASNLPDQLQATWAKEGHKFMQQEAKRIQGVKDRINAASKLSEAFAEQYGSGTETIHGNEGDRFHRRAEIEANHAETWADEQERKYYAAAAREERRRQPEPAPAPAKRSKKSQPAYDDEVPF